MEIANNPALSIKKTSRMLEVSPSYVSYLLAEGELDFFLPPGKKHRKVTLESINKFIERYTYNNKMKDEERKQYAIQRKQLPKCPGLFILIRKFTSN
ncbi:MAG: hypothetical protein WCE54_19485 [Ignavibacteriaceae bacterium]